MWYNDLGFYENPFDANASHKLVSYEGIIDDVLYNISAGNIIFIEGKEGTGKTSVLKKAIQKFMGRGKVAYIECEKEKSLNIEEVLKGKNSLIERLFKKMPAGMIVLMDDIAELDKKNTERVKYFYDQNYIKSIVFAGESYAKANFSESLKDRIKAVIKINELKDYEAIDILNSRLGDKKLISDDIAREIFERTDRNPKRFLNACEELCKKISETKEPSVTIDHVNSMYPHAQKKEQPEKLKKNIAKKKSKEEENPQKLNVIYEEDIAERYY
ncbi:AAA family ATPase [Candidatus Woesearchaeota archaeon]|nr:AAA family ATPase [Candidatus Woesearchaeota archaeon]